MNWVWWQSNRVSPSTTSRPNWISWLKTCVILPRPNLPRLFHLPLVSLLIFLRFIEEKYRELNKFILFSKREEKINLSLNFFMWTSVYSSEKHARAWQNIAAKASRIKEASNWTSTNTDRAALHSSGARSGTSLSSKIRPEAHVYWGRVGPSSPRFASSVD